jgi:hypothetical protein
LPAYLDDLPLADRLVEYPATDPVARLEHERTDARRRQLPRRHQPGQPGAHDRDVGLELFGHGRLSIASFLPAELAIN